MDIGEKDVFVFFQFSEYGFLNVSHSGLFLHICRNAGRYIKICYLHQDVPVFLRKKHQRDAVENTGGAARCTVCVR